MKCLDISPRAPRTHCRNGHEYTPETTRTIRDGRRECITCAAERDARERYNREEARIRRDALARYRPAPHQKRATTTPIPSVTLADAPVYRLALHGALGASYTQPGAAVHAEPDTSPPPRLLLAGPWQPPQFDREGRVVG